MQFNVNAEQFQTLLHPCNKSKVEDQKCDVCLLCLLIYVSMVIL